MAAIVQHSKAKGRRTTPFGCTLWDCVSGGLVFALLFLDWSRILALGVDVAVDELDHAHRRRVAVAEAGLEHARIAAIALLVARADDGEELLDHVDVADFGDRL